MQKKDTVILFPIGVIEEHGPHISLCADIAWSYGIAKRVKDGLLKKGKESLIAPPYYFGVNSCTVAFPGTFSLKSETVEMVLVETFENLYRFGFKEVYCFNYHGDAKHVNAILKAIQTVNKKESLKVKLVFDEMNLRLYNFLGDENFLLVINPEYPMSVFEQLSEGEENKLDIHAGAYETGMLHTMYPSLVNLDMVQELLSTSLTRQEMKQWLEGGEAMREMLPDGYAGNPRGYEAVSRHAEEIIAL